MRLQRIPLEHQLGQLRHGIPAHPEFEACAIRSWAATTLEEYFGDAQWSRKKLAEILGIPPGDEKRMTYREAAAGVYRLWQDAQEQPTKERLEEARLAVTLLAVPVFRFNCRRRLRANGKKKDDT